AVALRLVVAVWTGPTILPFVGQVQPLSNLFIHISNVIVFSAIAVALVRYRVVAVTPWVRRAVVYPLAIAVIVGAYDLFAGAIGRALAALLGSDIASNPAFAALPVLIVVALLRP